MKGNCPERFETDPVYRGALLYYLYLLADSCVSLAEMVIKKKSLRIPQSYQEAFDFAKIAGFRNFLAHDYEKMDMKLICEDTLAKVKDVGTFVDQVKSSLQISY